MKTTRFLAFPLALASTLATAQVTAFSSLNFGVEDPVLGTARYSGMAGAMGALGGNASTLRDNPAGIATSTKSDIGITPNIYANNEGKVSFNINDFSAVFNINHASSGYVSSALAVSYSRMRNFNRASYRTATLNYHDISANDEVRNSVGYLTDENSETGGTGKVNLAYAGNINNMIYFGIDFGITSLRYQQRSIYNMTSEDNQDDYDRHWLYPDDYYRKSNGFGCNFAVGMIVQPADFVRIGASVQTPTLYNIDEYWDFSCEGPLDEFGNSVRDIHEYDDSYQLHVPMKFTGSLGFMIGDRVNIGIDYSMRNYTKTWAEVGERPLRDLEADCKAYLQRQHTLKLGVEANIVGNLDLRAGYSLVSAPILGMADVLNEGIKLGGIYVDNATPRYSVTTPQKTQYITAGIGYTGRIGYVDFAYVHKLADEQYMEQIPLSAAEMASQRFEDVKSHSNHFMLSLGLRF